MNNDDLGKIEQGLKAHADPNFAPEGLPATCTAAGLGCSDIVDLLLTYGGDANIRDKDGRTPVMWAAVFCKDDAAKQVLDVLHKHGADLHATVDNGINATDLAKTFGSRTAYDWLNEHGAETTHAGKVRFRDHERPDKSYFR